MLKKIIVAACATALTAGVSVAIAVEATAGTQPVVSSISAKRGAYWGGTAVTVQGSDFTKVRQVTFGATRAWGYRVLSSTQLQVTAPWHSYGSVYVRVVTATGTSAKTASAVFTYVKPTMNDKIQGGMTGRQAQAASAKVRAGHRGVRTAKKAKRWTPAMGRTALLRARSWLGLPYSWAGGNGSGPTKGVCAHNGGDLDCRIIGFDCSGLTLNAWWPYKHMAHLASAQRKQAGKFRPAVGELMPGDLLFFSGYISGGVGHVAIYEGNGNAIEAPQSGSVVRRTPVAELISHNGTYRGAVRPTSIGRQGSVPVVTGSTPTVPAAGGQVVITGRNLNGATSVTVGNKVLYRLAARTASRIVVNVPASARGGKVALRVSNAWGTATRTLTYAAPPVVTPAPPTTTPPTSPAPSSVPPTTIRPTQPASSPASSGSSAPKSSTPKQTTVPAPTATSSAPATTPAPSASVTTAPSMSSATNSP